MASSDKLVLGCVCAILFATLCGAGLDAYVRTHPPCVCAEVKP